MKLVVPALLRLGISIFSFTFTASSASSHAAEIPSNSVTKIDLSKCDCFTVSGPDPGYFEHYKLWDFRQVPLDQSFDVHGPTNNNDDEDNWDVWNAAGEHADYDDEKEEGENDEDEERNEHIKQPRPDSLFFFKTGFDRDWVSQMWARHRTPIAPVTMVNSKRNVFFTRAHGRSNPDATYLILRTTRYDNFTSTAEIETRAHNIWHCSLRVRMRILPANVAIAQPPHVKEWPRINVQRHAILRHSNTTTFVNISDPHFDIQRPPSGACMGIFTYHSRDCESDIEILTSDPKYRVRYANQPDYDPVTDEMIPGASTVADLPVPWTSWSTQRLDWYPNSSRWYVNNDLQDAKSYRVPALQSRLVINLWSDGGVWTGDMRIGDTIYVGIEYIELAYNRSSDGSKAVGVPPSQRHGGHQVLVANTTMTNIDEAKDSSSWSDNEIITSFVKKKKCKKGRKGRKCRKKKKKHPKGGKGGKGGPDGEKRCVRVCNIDDLHYAGTG